MIMGRLKFKPNLGASRGSTGGSGASVGGGKARAAVGRGQQREMRQSGDESTGGESVGEVEAGEPFEVDKLKESGDGHSSGPEQTMVVDGSRAEDRQEGNDGGSAVMETDIQDDTLLTESVERTSELEACSTAHSVEDGGGATNRQSESRSSLHKGVQKGPVGRWTRKKVAPKIASGRPKRLGQKEKGSRIEELNRERISDPNNTARGFCSEAEESSVTTLAGHSSAEDGSEAEVEKLTDGPRHHKVAGGDFNTIPSKLNSSERSTGSVVRTRTCSNTSTDLAVVRECARGLSDSARDLSNCAHDPSDSARDPSDSARDPSDSAHDPSDSARDLSDSAHDPRGQECTDEAISNTLNEVLQSVHTTAQLAPNDTDLSGIVRSSLDLLCPPPPLSQVGNETLIPDHPRPNTVMQDSYSDNEKSGEVLPSNLQGPRSTSALSGSHISSKNSSSSNLRTDSVVGGSDGDMGAVDSGSQPGLSAPSRSQEGVSKGGRKRRRRSGTKRKRSSTSVVDDDDPTTPSPSSSQPKKPRVCSGKATKKVREAPDRSKMTMQDLIYYNPTANPMSSTVEEKKLKLLTREEGDREQQEKGRGQPEEGRTPTQTQPKSPLTRQRENGEREEEEEEEEEEGRIVPKLRIGKDGSIVLDEQSMVVKNTWKPSEEAGDLVFESSGHTTSASFRKSYRVNKWTREETSKFFKALSQVGTDFTMMTLLLPLRSRKELKNKFKKEEKSNPHLVGQALKNQLSLQKLCQE